MITTSPMTSTSSVVSPRCTSTLSITTWKNSGLTSANSCRNSEIVSTSPSSRRCLTMLGMNQEKSNLASSPARLARLVIRISSPVHSAAKVSMGSIVGRADASSPLGSMNSTRLPSHCASTTVRPSRSVASAGSAASVRRSIVVRDGLALSPSRLAASSKSRIEGVSVAPNPRL